MYHSDGGRKVLGIINLPLRTQKSHQTTTKDGYSAMRQRYGVSYGILYVPIMIRQRERDSQTPHNHKRASEHLSSAEETEFLESKNRSDGRMVERMKEFNKTSHLLKPALRALMRMIDTGVLNIDRYYGSAIQMTYSYDTYLLQDNSR